MKPKPITVLHKNPGAEPTEQVIDANSVEDLQKLVGGYFEPIKFTPSVVLWVNEEGKLKNLAPNIEVPMRGVIVGMVALTGQHSSAITTLPDIPKWKAALNEMAVSVEFEMTCMGCGLLMTPTTTDWEAFRQGIHVHDALPCHKALDMKLSALGGTPLV